jgi:hypothetical protein
MYIQQTVTKVQYLIPIKVYMYIYTTTSMTNGRL